MEKELQKNRDFETHDEFEEFEGMFTSYITEMPSDEEIDSSIDQIMGYFPAKQKKRPEILKYIDVILQQAGRISSWYWAVSIGLIIAGVFGGDSIDSYMQSEAQRYIFEAGAGFGVTAAAITTAQHYILIGFLSSIPVVLGLVELFKGREEGMLELEMSFKISSGQAMFSKIVVIGICSLIIDIFLMAVFVVWDTNLIFTRLCFMSLAPFTLSSGIGLWLVSKFRGSHTAAIFTSFWVILLYAAMTNIKIALWITSFGTWVYALMLCAGILLSAKMIRAYSDRRSDFYERGILNGAKN